MVPVEGVVVVVVEVAPVAPVVVVLVLVVVVWATVVVVPEGSPTAGTVVLDVGSPPGAPPTLVAGVVEVALRLGIRRRCPVPLSTSLP